MKKLMSLVIFLLLLVVVWGGANWYIGQKTHELLQQQIDKSNTITAVQGVREELVSYDKTFLGAKAVVNLVMEQPPLNEWTKGVRLIGDIQNGPLLWGEHGLGFGLSRWHLTLDEASIENPDARARLKELFVDKPPVDVWMDAGFDNQAKFDVVINPLSYQDKEVNISLAGVQFGGSSVLTGEQLGIGKFDGKVGKLALSSSVGGKVDIPAIDVQGEATGYIGSTMLGDISLKAQDISILAQGAVGPVVFNTDIKTHSALKDDNLEGQVQLQVSDVKGLQDQVNNASYELNYSGLKLEGFQAFSDLQKELQSIQAQIAANDENTETPEGQRKTMELFGQLQELTNRMMETLFTKTLQAGKSRIHQVVNVDNPKGKALLDADLTYVGAKQVPNMDALMTYTPDQWAALLNGEIKFNADKAMLPPMSEMLFAAPVQQGVIVDSPQQYQANVKLLGDTVNLNGAVITFGEFLAKLAPSIPAGQSGGNGSDGSGSELNVPDDVLQKIVEQGFTTEVMQMIEESDDIDPEARDLLKQLQEMEASGLISRDSIKDALMGGGSETAPDEDADPAGDKGEVKGEKQDLPVPAAEEKPAAASALPASKDKSKQP